MKPSSYVSSSRGRIRGALASFALLVVFTLVTHAERAQAQQLSPEITEACIRAAVKVVAIDPNGRALGTGSGSMIDPRGYVLTNFHVVGNTRPDHGVPGTLHNPENLVHIATVAHARQAARPGWIGRVVRADARLDLALIRIVADVSGRPVGNHRFPTVPLGSLDGVNPGTRVWAFGYPLNVRTINVTSGDIAGLEINTRDEVSWIRSDAEFNPGNSGGMLVDVAGRLVGIPTSVFAGQRGVTLEPIELARPVERLPGRWLSDLRRGPIDDVEITGVIALRAGGPAVESVALGDGQIGSPDQHFFRVSAAGAVATEPPLPIAVMRGDEVLRSSTGSVDVLGSDPSDVVISILVPRGEVPVPYRVQQTRGDTTPVEDPVAQAPPPAGPAPDPFLDADPAGSGGPVDPRPNGSPTGPSGGAVAVASGTAVQVVVLDAVSGRPVDGGALLMIGRPGVDVMETLALVLRNQISEAALRQRLVGVGVTDETGTARVEGVSAGEYPMLIHGRSGYRMLRGSVRVPPNAGQLHSIGVVRMNR